MTTMDFIEAVLRSTAVLLATGALALVCSRFSHATRHRIWSYGLIASAVILAMPLLGTAPMVEIPVSALALSSVGGADSSIPVATWLLGIWIIGVACSALAVVTGVWSAARLVKRATLIDHRAIPTMATSRLATGVVQDVYLAESDDTVVPAVWGINKPVVILPPRWRSWPDETLQGVLTHELAHVARRDTLLRLVNQFARAVLWWNPLAWLAESRALLAAEQDCDHIAWQTSNPRDYAALLLSLVRDSKSSLPGAAMLAMARGSGVRSRVRAIIDDSPKASLSAWTIALILLTVGACSAVSSLEPTVNVIEARATGGIVRPMSPEEASQAAGTYMISQDTVRARFMSNEGETGGVATFRERNP